MANSDLLTASLIANDSLPTTDVDRASSAPNSVISVDGVPAVDFNTRLIITTDTEEVVIPTMEDIETLEEGGTVVAGSYVSFSQTQTSGDELASITIDGVTSRIYSPKSTVDSTLSGSSRNAIQNRAVYEALSKKYEKPENGIPKSDLVDGIIPTSLKNPYPLIINGTEYDGSSKTELTISGSGGSIGSGPVAAECVILGDSLSSGYMSGGSSDTSNHYDRAWPIQLVNDNVCTVVHNHAYGGAQIKDYANDDSQPSLIEQYNNNKDDWSSPDLFILEGGTNDARYFRYSSSYSYNDAKEALSTLIDTIRDDYPSARIVFIRTLDTHATDFGYFATSHYMMDVLTVLCMAKRVQVISYTGTTQLTDDQFYTSHPNTAACEVIGHYIGARLYDRVTYFPEGPIVMYFVNDSSDPNTYNYDFLSIEYLLKNGCDVVAEVQYTASSENDTLLALRWTGETESSRVVFISPQYVASTANVYLWILSCTSSNSWYLNYNQLMSWTT